MRERLASFRDRPAAAQTREDLEQVLDIAEQPGDRSYSTTLMLSGGDEHQIRG